MKEIFNSLNWCEPRLVSTARGPRHLRLASPSPDFWAAWRSDKAGLQAAGFSARPGQNGWEVLHWSEVDAVLAQPSEGAPAPAPAKYPAGAQVRQARRVESFQAPALDSSRPWSAEQLAIFEWFRAAQAGENLVVQARAGTGKTTTIKVAFSQAPEEKMLYAVFNKRNQIEAKNAIQDSRVEVLTLHAVGYKLIRSVWSNAKPEDSVEFDRARQACGQQAPDEVVRAVAKLVGFSKNLFVAPKLEELIDLADARDISAEGWEDYGWDAAGLAQAALDVLDLSKERDAQGRVSFNDMVWLPVAKGWLRGMYDLVVVDEAQDMNLCQLLMARGVCRAGGRIAVVGDDRQAIYGFRGACQDGMGKMQRDLSAKVLGLTITYRCPKAVVALAAEIVKDYQAAPSAPAGVIADVASNKLVDVLEIGDAVLSRTNAPLMPLCLSLLRKGVPARIEGRDVGKALVSIVEKFKARSVPEFITRASNWGQKQLARFKNSKHAEEKAALVDDQVETLVALADGCKNVQEVKDRITNLFSNADESPKPAVVFSSTHKAKGLEWKRVAILTDTYKPTKGDEEANIYYVAITRAKSELLFVR